VSFKKGDRVIFIDKTWKSYGYLDEIATVTGVDKDYIYIIFENPKLEEQLKWKETKDKGGGFKERALKKLTKLGQILK
jgi:hypothetical protein